MTPIEQGPVSYDGRDIGSVLFAQYDDGSYGYVWTRPDGSSEFSSATTLNACAIAFACRIAAYYGAMN